jgi:putative ABC transport system ATP-binding protein
LSGPTRSPPLYELSHVSKSFGERSARTMIFDDFNFAIAKGEFLAIMGPSGSGKSTLLNLLSGLDRPTGGEIRFEGNRVDNLRGGRMARWRARHVGIVFQAYNLVPVLSALQNVELPLLLTNLGAAKRRSNAQLALQLVGLADRVNYPPRKLSGGQQQRVAIARAIVSDPTVLLCDEPTGNLDRATANELLTLLQQLNRQQGKTVVMVTHDPDAAKYASAVRHLDKGLLTQVARTP